MQVQLPLAILVGVVAGGAGAFGAMLFQDPAPAATVTPSGALDPSADLGGQVRALADSNSKLLERLERLETRGGMVAPNQVRVPAVVGNESLDFEAAVAAAIAKLNTAPSGAIVTPDFRKQVETVIELRDEESRLVREQERAQRESQVLEDRLARLQSDLSLDSKQVDAMRKVFLDMDTKREEMRTSMREAGGNDFQNVREQWQALAEGMDTQLRGLLNPVQFDLYKEQNPDPRFGGGGRGGNQAFGGGRGAATQGGGATGATGNTTPGAPAGGGNNGRRRGGS